MRGSEGLPLRPVSRSSAGEPATLYGWWSGPSMIHRIHQQLQTPDFSPPETRVLDCSRLLDGDCLILSLILFSFLLSTF